MLTVQLEIRPLLNKLRVEFDKIFRIALQLGTIDQIPMVIVQIGNLGNKGVMNCLGRGVVSKYIIK